MFYHLKHGKVFKITRPCPKPKKETETMTTATTENKPKGNKGKGRFLKKTPKMKDRIRILDWLRERKNELLEERPRFAKVAEDIKKELLIDVSEDTICNTARDGGMPWHEKKEYLSRKAGHHRIYTGKNDTRDRLAVIAQQTQLLRAAITQLFKSLSEPIPTNLGECWPEYHNNKEIPEDKPTPGA